MSSTRTVRKGRKAEVETDMHREAGRRGGLTRATQHEGLVEEGKLSIEEAGRLGGSAVAAKYGQNYFAEIGRMGGLARGAVGDVEVITDKFLNGKSDEMGIPKVTGGYLKLMAEFEERTKRHRMICREFIDRAWKTLARNGFDTPEMRPYARSIIEGSCDRIGWNERTIMLYMPDTLKDEFRAILGAMGGNARAAMSAAGSLESERLQVGETEGYSADVVIPPSQPAAATVSWRLEYSAEVKEKLKAFIKEADAAGATVMMLTIKGRKLVSIAPAASDRRAGLGVTGSAAAAQA